VEEVVAVLAGNLEVHEGETFSREDRLLTFVAEDRCSEFHGLTSWPCVPRLRATSASRDCIVYGWIPPFTATLDASKIVVPAKMGTTCPYLRYRKWKEKDDNSYERLRS
jgi:hypothetical protein